MSQTDPVTANPSGPNPQATYWRSLDELQFTPQFEEFLHREFPKAASEFPEGISRRRWLQLMGASLSLAGVAGCRWEAEEFLPMANRVPDYIPGEFQYFATMQELRGFARALLVRKFDGRPIKVEGNPQHPQSHGATDVFAQACILDLYDPDRIGRPREIEDEQLVARTWEQAEDSIRSLAGRSGDGGSKLRILANASSSPSRQRLERAIMRRFPAAGWVEYEPISWQSAEQGAQLAFGRRLRPHYRFDQATVILVIDGDPFGSDPDQINHARGWAAHRAPEAGPMNRLYVVESTFSATGAAADHREALASSRIPAFLAELEAAIDQALEGGAESDNPFLTALASDLVESRGKGLIYVGPRQPAEIHVRAQRLNARLENLGQTVYFTEDESPERPPYAEAITRLTEEMRNGDVDTLVILRGNPVYDAPADLEFDVALRKVPNAIHLSEYQNETSLLCRWYLPATHAFEQWGDGRAYDGTYTLQQPLIAPLHAGRSEYELLAMLLGEGPRRGEQIVRETFRENLGGGEQDWKQALHLGFVPDTAFEAVDVSPQDGGSEVRPAATPLGEGEFEIVFLESEQVYDGRFANNAWLHESPAILTKITWDNAALLSFPDAERLNLKSEDMVRLTFAGRSIEMPVYVLPGQAVGSVGVALGYGRTAAGLVGGVAESSDTPGWTVGFDVYQLRTTGAMTFGVGLEVMPTEEVYPLATTQDHHALDTIGLEEIAQRVPLLIREATPELLEEHPGFVQHAVHHPPLESLWESPDYSILHDDPGDLPDHAWGMTVDLTKCIGCNACVVACQSENNVPVVGKEQVLRGREMHWLRIDRYFRGDPNAEGTGRGGVVLTHQPVLCMHCEHAPCESVCPVAAAVHDHEGLNLMVYNRCVGTRYCNNNCPYKVRRFNFFNWNKEPVNKKYLGLTVLNEAPSEEEVEKNQALAGLVHNPEVTVRSRGVMEKCTYCIQRIQLAKIEARNEAVREGHPTEVRIPDLALQTACQQTCPTNAIVFGDLMDPNSLVRKFYKNPRTYAMLQELNTRPRTRYMARIRNPHPLLAESEPYAIPPVGHASEHHDEPGHDEHEEDHHS